MPSKLCPKCGERHELDDACPNLVKEAHHWSRHHDLIQWTSKAIFWTAIGTLYVKFLDEEKADARLRLLGIALLLTALSYFTVWSFRRFRWQVHAAYIPPVQRKMYRTEAIITQGMVHILIHGIIAGGLLAELHFLPGVSPCLTIPLGICTALFTVQQMISEAARRSGQAVGEAPEAVRSGDLGDT